MKKFDYFSVRESIRLISICFPLLFFTKDTNIFSINWVLILLILGNIRRLNKTNKFYYFCRIIGYFLPYLIIGIIFHKYCIINITLDFTYSIILALVIGIIYIFINIKEFNFLLSNMVIQESLYHDKLYYFLQIINRIGASISEELFFRYYLISIYFRYGYISIFISSIYFVLGHFLLPWGNSFKLKDYINQLVIGFLSSLLYYFSNNIIGSIILHLIINFPDVIYLIKSFLRHHMHSGHYENLVEEDIFDSIDI